MLLQHIKDNIKKLVTQITPATLSRFMQLFVHLITELENYFKNGPNKKLTIDVEAW